jgi:hypothetical protein
MFRRLEESCAKDPEFIEEANAAFKVLVDSLVEQQLAGIVRGDEPLLLARFRLGARAWHCDARDRRTAQNCRPRSERGVFRGGRHAGGVRRSRRGPRIDLLPNKPTLEIATALSVKNLQDELPRAG